MFNRNDLVNENLKNLSAQSKDENMLRASKEWLLQSHKYKIAYQLSWLGQPIIQLPSDIVAIQELIWKNKPDIIIETGTAWGGGTLMLATFLSLYRGSKVISIDINLNTEVKSKILNSSVGRYVELYKSSSTDPIFIENLKKSIPKYKSVMVFLDSNHSYHHVISELECYGELVTPSQYIVVSSTFIAQMPIELMHGRPWSQTENPKTAIDKFISKNDRFIIDEEFSNKLLLTYNPNGYLKCIR